MKKINSILILLLACVFVFAGCGETGKDTGNPTNAPETMVQTDAPENTEQTDAPETTEATEETELYFSIDAYGITGSTLKVTMTDGTIAETGAYGLAGKPGDTIGDVLTAQEIAKIEPYLEGDTFEGWAIFEAVVEVDADGFESSTYKLRSGDKLYTTEEILAMPIIPEYTAEIVAKWSSIALEDYFVEEDYMWEVGVTTCAISLSGNGGQLVFQAGETTDTYESTVYNYWLEEGQTLTDVMAEGMWDTFVEAKKEGAEFAGWTVYEADSFSWSGESVNDETKISFPFEEMEEFEYIVLENGKEYSSDMTTEELCQLVMADKSYFAMANWK